MNNYIYSIAFAIMPILTMVGKVMIGQANEFKHYIALFIPVLMFFFIGYFIIGNFEEYNFPTKHMPLSVAVLITIDQLTKLVVYKFLGNAVVNIPGNMYMIKMVKNKQINALFNIMEISSPSWVTTIARISTLVIVGVFFWYCENKYNKDVFLNIAKIFTYATVISSIIDSSFWGYTLDFIVFKRLQAIDIKDVYSQLGIGFLLMYSIKNKLLTIKRYSD